MEKIIKKYTEAKNRTSDINEHLETLFEYGKQCKHITEMGVRNVVSTWAFLASNPSKMISYDICHNNRIDELLNIVTAENINFSFIKEDVLKVDIEPTDLLFIDTLHAYNQLIQELNKHSKKVKKYIILHDTTKFETVDESIYNHASDLVKKNADQKGLKAAINNFLNYSEDGLQWGIEKIYTNNNGLTILKRK